MYVYRGFRVQRKNPTKEAAYIYCWDFHKLYSFAVQVDEN
jgi:hypothetical protein